MFIDEKNRYAIHIPPGTLRDWAQDRKEPDAAARAYLAVIARIPAAVSEAVHPTPSEVSPRLPGSGRFFFVGCVPVRMRHKNQD